MTDLRYPIGKFVLPQSLSAQERAQMILNIEELPQQIRTLLASFSERMMDIPYREGGWNPRQLIHHLADSHMNAYIRFKLALTEDNPVIRPYREERWAELPDARSSNPELSVRILEAIHERWVLCMHHISESDWSRTFHHPESKIDYKLFQSLALYDWHGRHHFAHLNLEYSL